jgi:uncharacterized protein YegL
MKDVANENPFAQMSVRTVTFSSGARWHDSQPTPVEDIRWTDMEADGVTDMGAGLKLLAEELAVEKMGTRGYPPVLVLLSDGQPTDNYKEGLDAVMSQQWGKRAARIAIGIGKDADDKPLQEFIGNIEFPVLRANNPQELTKYIKWVSSEVSKAASAPASQGKESQESESNIQMPVPPPPADSDDDDVW